MPDTISRVTVERSPDASTWAIVKDNPGSLNQFSDPTAPNPKLYYRVTEYSAGGIVIPHDIGVIQIASPSGTVNWLKGFGGTSSDAGQAVASDASENSYLAGYFSSGSIDFGNGFTVNKTSTGQNMFLTKINSAGQAQWAKGYGGSGSITVTSIAVDASGNTFVGGYCSGTIDLGMGLMTASFNYDMFVAKYNSSGVAQWAKIFASSGINAGYDSVTGLAVDTNGNVVVTGFFQGNVIDFGLGAQYNGPSGFDSFLAKLSGSSGAAIWAKAFACSTDNQANGVAVDSNGDIVVVGKMVGCVDLTNNSGSIPFPYPPTTLCTVGGSDFYIGKFAGDGTYVWSKRFGGSQNDNALGIAVDSSLNIFVAGYFTSSMNMGVGAMTTVGTTDPFVSKLSSSGACVWSKSLAGGHYQTVSGIAVDGSGNVSITGTFDQFLNFGAGSVNSSALFQNTAFVAKYSGSASGLNPANYQWAQILNGNAGNQFNGITTDSAGHVLAAGWFLGTATMDIQNITSAGSFDGCLVRITP